MTNDLPAQINREFHRCVVGSNSEIETLNEDIHAWALSIKVPIKAINSVALMMDELITNVVMHGYKKNSEGEIDIHLQLIANTVAVTIRDNAPEFNPFLIAEPDTALDIDEREIGGLGIHFVRKMADHFSYRRDGNVNEVHFTKTWST